MAPVIEKVMQEYAEIQLTGTGNNRKILGSMNDISDSFQFMVADEGGLEWCTIEDITRRINRTPIKAFQYKYPVEVLKQQLA